MDLQAFLRVIARFRVLVAAGFFVAVMLSLLAFAKVDFSGGKPHLAYRSHELWESNARLLLTEPGFKWGNNNPGPHASEIEGRLPGLAAIYSSFVTSDAVMRIIYPNGGPITGTVIANPLQAGLNGDTTLPVVNILAIDTSIVRAIKLANRSAAALKTYVRQQQEDNDVPASERIELQPLNVSFEPKLIQPRSKTLPIVVFMAVMFCTLSLAILLDNLRPPSQPKSEPEVPQAEASSLARMPRPEHEPSVARDHAQHVR